MKYLLIGVIIAALVVAGLVIFGPKPSKDLEQAQVKDVESNESGAVDDSEEDMSTTAIDFSNNALDFSLTGFGPGKSHHIIFESYKIKDVRVGDDGIPTKGTITFQTDSVKTDTAMLDGHLCNKPNFLNCSVYPSIIFNLENITKVSGTSYKAEGELTIKETTKTISFPLDIVNGKVTARFRVNIAEFDVKEPGIVNDEVEVKFTGTL